MKVIEEKYFNNSSGNNLPLLLYTNDRIISDLTGTCTWHSSLHFWLKKLSYEELLWLQCTYRKVASRSMFQLVAYLRIFRMFMKGKFEAYVLWPLAKSFQDWIVAWSTACDVTVCYISQSNARLLYSSRSLY